MTVSPTHRDNFRHLYWDVFWYGIVAGTTLAFQAVYAARIGASSLQISLLTAGPALVNLLLSVPAGRWMDGRSFGRVALWTAVVQRFGFLAMAALPLVGGPDFQIFALIGIILLMSLPGTYLSIAFNSLFAEATPAEWRAEVVGKRNALMAVSMTVSTLLAGQMLDRIPMMWNYALVFLFGALGSVLSTVALSKIRTQDFSAAPALPSARARLAGRLGIARAQLTQAAGRAPLRLDMLRGSFGLFMLAYLSFYTFQYVGAPLFPLFFVDELQLSNSAISLGNSLFYALMFLVSLRLTRLTARYGHRRLAVAGALAFSLYPLIMGLSQGPGLYWVASLAGGAVWAVVGAAMLNRLMERVPDGQRAAYMAMHNLVLNLGILAGSLVSPLITEAVGVRPAMFVSFGLRLLAGILMLLWG